MQIVKLFLVVLVPLQELALILLTEQLVKQTKFVPMEVVLIKNQTAALALVQQNVLPVFV